MYWYGLDSYLEGGFSTTLKGTITGNKESPVASYITGNQDKPVGSHLTGSPDKPIGSRITGDTKNPVVTQLTGDHAKPIASTVDLLNIPHLTLSDIKDIITPKIRMHIPNYQQMSFKLLGVELFTWCTSGESEIITQPYVPNRFEECKIICPEEDLRPFPKTSVFDKKQ